MRHNTRLAALAVRCGQALDHRATQGATAAMGPLVILCTALVAPCRYPVAAQPSTSNRQDQPASASERFPAVPKPIFGVNQYNVGPPDLEGKHWPLKDDEIEKLKALGRQPAFRIEPDSHRVDSRRL